MIHQLSPKSIRTGMFVCGFGGSWFGHPFWKKRFLVESESDLARIHRSAVPFVLIDDARGVGIESLLQAPFASIPDQPAPEDRIADRAFRRAEARRLATRSKQAVRQMYLDARLGHAVILAELTQIVDEIAALVEQAPQTLLEVLRLKRKDEYTFIHSVAVCTLMVNAARHMGRSEADVHAYGLAGLLHDIGKVRVPDSILNKSERLSDAELTAVHDHAELGFKMLSSAAQTPAMVLDVCRHHHEKVDGSGYPSGLKGDEISEAARLCAICDVYDALTSERPYKKAWAPGQAITAMWSWQGHFDRELLFAMIQSIGIYPTGLLVELHSQRLGVVLPAEGRNARPRVLAFYSTADRRFLAPEPVPIGEGPGRDRIIARADALAWGLGDWQARIRHVPAAQSRAA